MKAMVRKILPTTIKKWIKGIVRPTAKNGWFGDYSSWDEARKQCSGYDHSVILEKVIASTRAVKNGEALFERDSVLFYEEHYSESLLQAFKYAAEQKQGDLFVVDFGGALGSTWMQNKKRLLEFGTCKWSVVEQEHFVKVGSIEFSDEQLSFYPDIQKALSESGRNPHVLLLSSVLQYLEDPFQFIAFVCTLNFPVIIIDRTAFIESTRDVISMQIVPEFVYRASYPAWFFTEEKFVKAFSSQYEVISDFPSAFDDDGELNGKRVYRKGFLLKRKS